LSDGSRAPNRNLGASLPDFAIFRQLGLGILIDPVVVHWAWIAGPTVAASVQPVPRTIKMGLADEAAAVAAGAKIACGSSEAVYR
jgi:hypothetical protein